MEKNDVSSFFYYMWNTWSKEECEKVFTGSNCPWTHLWNKYCGYYSDLGYHGAISMFYANINTEYQDLLVKRATELYNGKQLIK